MIKYCMATTVAFLLALPASSDLLCQSTKTKQVKVSKGSKCSSGYKLIVSTSAFKGSNGADGQLRVYGNGSLGDVSIGTSTTLTNTIPQYSNVSIAAGRTLTVPSGTVIRCSGSFINAGTIVVTQGAMPGVESITSFLGAYIWQDSGPHPQPAIAFPHPGWSARAAGIGELTGGTSTSIGGAGGLAMDAAAARGLLRPGPYGGGAGAGTTFGSGGAGGGSLVILCKGSITNSGVIVADGASPTSPSSGSGGGAGGIIILASGTSVSNSGVIAARGANGASNFGVVTPGGGGGGGLIHFLAPSVTSSGSTLVTGGTGGQPSNSVTSDHRSGAGGGACAGAGGAGSTSSGTSAGAGGNGAAGLTLTTLTDPAPLF